MESKISKFLEKIELEIGHAGTRQFNLARDAEIAQVKNQVVGEYRSKLMDLRDELREIISSGNEG
jgi:hypothetical protein